MVTDGLNRHRIEPPQPPYLTFLQQPSSAARRSARPARRLGRHREVGTSLISSLSSVYLTGGQLSGHNITKALLD